MHRTLPSFEELYAEADRFQERIGLAVAGGDDPTVLLALQEAVRRGWVVPFLCGSAERIHSLAAELGIDLSRFRIQDSAEPAVTAVEMIHQGNANLMMKGQIATPDLMRAVLDKQQGLRTGDAICQMVLMEIPRDNKRFLLTDTGITIEPDFERKVALLLHLQETARALGCEHPRLAIMSASEKVNTVLPDTVAADQLMQLAKTDPRFTASAVSGPLSFDLAYDIQAGQKKQLADPVIGQADGMLFPNLLTANLTVKAIMYTADCHFGGLLCGTSAPVVFMSRADDVNTRLNSLAYTLKILRTRKKTN